ncbi:hypothetical protein I3842_05G157100 [Carya illinoinensis]|uniref:NAD-dependent epimerase/dehydratase domain-containing protein n=2 Tax=Carya illinoinensis TaxID=32201 RepID=A0A922EZX3_CARIL|nr:hypothetical protein I3842_05G156900 [Carya illinoinensis]KAG6713519.1 hypothetical protein I3842_05G157100 [Carya illinoinensis]
MEGGRCKWNWLQCCIMACVRIHRFVDGNMNIYIFIDRLEEICVLRQGGQSKCNWSRFVWRHGLRPDTNTEMVFYKKSVRRGTEKVVEQKRYQGERMSGGAEKVVCVTGASGYIASWLVKLLLQRGYTVNASVRDPNDPKKTEHLLMLDGAKERLHLFKADLLEEGSFDSLVDGCEGVFHTATPVYLSANNPQAELIEPAVKGTLNVLRSCAKVSSVKRVVITSSMAAVVYNGKPLTPDVLVDETWFSDPAFCEESKLWYMLSKTLAEKAAWEFSKENGIDMVAMHPGWVSGPLLQPIINTSLEPFLKLAKGAESIPFMSPRWVDVRDVANAHILAFENPSASGRYCLVGRVLQFFEFVKLMHELFPDINIPEKCGDDHPFASSYMVSRERAESLGLNFTPVEVTLKDTFESLRASNFFNI